MSFVKLFNPFVICTTQTPVTTFELTPEAKISLTTPAIPMDNEGITWNVFGEGISGPRKGEYLIPTTSFMGHWFSWRAFYPGVEIYDF